jgi:elongation factor G
MLSSEDVRTVAVVGHKGAGKTSLIEAAMFVGGAAPKKTKNGDHAGGLDDTPEEKAIGATLEARCVSLKWGKTKINLIDTPGDAGFVADTRVALAAADSAIVVVSAKDGVGSGTERVFRWIREAQLPCAVVITKVDDPNARVDSVLEEVKGTLRAPIAMMEVPSGAGPEFRGVVAVGSGKAWIGDAECPTTKPVPVPAESERSVSDTRAHLVDDVAATDDTLTEHYLERGDLTQDELDDGARHAVSDCKLVPVYEASSVEPHGIAALLDAVVDVLPSPSVHAPWRATDGSERLSSSDAPFAALVLKTRIDPHAGRIAYARVLSGTHGESPAGDVVLLTKHKSAKTGDTLSDEKSPFELALPARPAALFSRALIAEGRGASDKAAATLARMIEEDPGLVVTHDEATRDTLVSGLGALHLEVTLQRLRRRASIDCKLGPPRVPYCETVRGRVMKVEGKLKKQTGGHGQFGVCVIDVEPRPRGSGFLFEDAVVGGAIPRQFISSVERGLQRALQHGVLGGYPVVDVLVRVVDGKAHSVDSSDAAFQGAAFRAFRAAMLQAQPVILEPVVRLDVTIPNDAVGAIIGDLNARHGKVLGTSGTGDGSVVSALVPLAQTLDYEPRLTAMTHGRGSYSLAFERYDYASPQVQEKAIRDSGYHHAPEED